MDPTFTIFQKMSSLPGAIMALATTAARSVDRTFHCPDGTRLEAIQWEMPQNHMKPVLTSKEAPAAAKKRVLCLHGWLDNTSSFHFLGPALSESPLLTSDLGYSDVVALDLPGHGLSSHKGPDGPTQILAEYAYYVAEAASAMGWWDGVTDRESREGGGDPQSVPQQEKFSIVGHSMGAGVAVMFAAAFPERVEKLVLLEVRGSENVLNETHPG